MNMPISSTPVSTVSGSASTAASGSGTSTTSNSGFAGALVQAIDGGSTKAVVAGALNLPVGLVNLLGQLGLEPTEEQPQDLLEMLGILVNQLQQLEQSDPLSKETEDQLAAMLTAFQGLLQQLGQTQPSLKTEQPTTTNTLPASQLTDSSLMKPVVQALRETLQQLSSVLASGKIDVRSATNFAGQLKTLLDPLVTKDAVVAQTVQADTNNAVVASTAIKTASTSEESVAVPKEALAQAAVVVQEPRRPIQVLREPLWRVNVVNATEGAVSGTQTVVVPTVAITEEVSDDSSSQPAWTFMQNDSLATAETTTAKAVLPAQVPVQQFAEQIEKFLVKQFLLRQGNGVSEAKITLNPEHLGQVDIRLVMHNGQITAQFMTDNVMARDLLENQMSQLRAALSSQGLQVDRLDVVQQPASSSNTSFMHQEQRQPNSGNNGNGSNGRSNGGLYEDPAVFAAELERSSFLRESGFGSSLNVTA